RAFAEKVHGKGKAFDKTKKMHNGKGITTTIINTLNPEYVKENVPENGAIARVSVLDYFNLNSNFNAGSRDVDYDYGRLRGVRRDAEGVEAQKIVVPKVYDISHVLEESSQTSSFAPDQIKKLQNILEQYNYKIIKGEAK
ncbi:MAG: hypothetical protein KJ583_06715, partial [Nanoarchaeota archaeon]|nr:hypothetical protein [Nanoarchaeota archaeon]MBU1604977.1 hypothetical protein [Nanoarchaeota archaeon]MBU2443087.1 hypothetical protein [Nanoarchaeota archaeon]